jgi:hypothetical protein
MLRLVLHAINAPEHEMGYESTETPRPGLLFVHDQGVYLMSNGIPRDTEAAQEGGHVVYADGCDPKIGEFDDWYGLSRELVGGDDFVEVLPFTNPQEFVDACRTYNEYCIEVTAERLESYFRSPKPATSTT